MECRYLSTYFLRRFVLLPHFGKWPCRVGVCINSPPEPNWTEITLRNSTLACCSSPDSCDCVTGVGTFKIGPLLTRDSVPTTPAGPTTLANTSSSHLAVGAQAGIIM